MQKKIISLAIAGAFLSPFAAFAEDAPSPLTFNVGVVSDYLFRGVSQTLGKPALQGGVDYAFANGAYVGAWASTVTWVKDYLGSGTTEIDVYGGYKSNLTPDITYDVGVISYNYPGKGSSTAYAGNPAFTPLNDPNTTEIYGALGYKWVTVKYSHTISKNFIGWVPYAPPGGLDYSKNTSGSNYLELNASYDLGNGWGVSGHVGKQTVKNVQAIPGTLTNADYMDYNIGVTKDVGFGVVGLTYSATDTSGTCDATLGGTNAYCFGKNLNSAASASSFKNVARDTVVLSFKKTF